MLKVFKHILEQSPEEAFKSLSSDILNDPKFRILCAHMDKLWTPGITKEFFIYIKKDSVSMLDFGLYPQDYESILLDSLNDFDGLEIDHRFNITKQNRLAGDPVAFLKSISMHSLVFYFTQKDLSIFSQGEIIKRSLFFTNEDYQKYSDKKDVSQIKEIFDGYRQLCGEKELFFDSKLELLDDSYKGKKILVNKPEQFMKAHLVKYLNENSRNTFSTNIELNGSSRVIDICTECDGVFHFLIINWLGLCVNDNYNGVCEQQGEPLVHNSVNTVLEFLKELDASKYGKNTDERGYLVLYDGREDGQTIDIDIQSYVNTELGSYISKFTKLDEIVLGRIAS